MRFCVRKSVDTSWCLTFGPFGRLFAIPYTRCRALARHTLTLHEGMFLVGTVYNFCTPHASLSSAQKTTPAMAAGITDHCWTIGELLSFHVPLSPWAPPKRRGRPSQALQHLMARWCAS